MLLAFDLDNTIVTQDNRILKRTREAIFAARAAGHRVTVLTGRTQASAKLHIDDLNLDIPYSLNHGALVLRADHSVVQQTVVTATDVRDIVARYAERPGIEYACIQDDTLFVRDPSDERWSWVHTESRYLKPFDNSLDLVADKLVLSCETQSRETHDAIRSSHPDLVLYLWNDNFIEVTGARSDKGAALALITEMLGVRRDETIAFGDGINDISMLQWAGRSVAVGSEPLESVLAVSDEHVVGPEQHGVAQWLEHNLL